MNSCTAALIWPSNRWACARQAVLVPTMTFAATAEVVLYQTPSPCWSIAIP